MSPGRKVYWRNLKQFKLFLEMSLLRLLECLPMAWLSIWRMFPMPGICHIPFARVPFSNCRIMSVEGMFVLAFVYFTEVEGYKRNYTGMGLDGPVVEG